MPALKYTVLTGILATAASCSSSKLYFDHFDDGTYFFAGGTAHQQEAAGVRYCMDRGMLMEVIPFNDNGIAGTYVQGTHFRCVTTTKLVSTDK